MTVRRVLVCGLLCAGLAGIVAAAPGDVLYDSMAAGDKEPGLVVLEGASPNLVVLISYLNMDATPGYSEGDATLRTRQARLAPRSGEPIGYVRPGTSDPDRIRR